MKCPQCEHDEFGVEFRVQSPAVIEDGVLLVYDTLFSLDQLDVTTVWCKRCGNHVDASELTAQSFHGGA